MAKITNLSDIAQSVQIKLVDGALAYVRVMPRAKGVELPPGAQVNGQWLALNPKVLHIVNDQVTGTDHEDGEE